MKAAVGEVRVHSSPAIALAARLPGLWTVASSPNAEPRRPSGARWATAALGGLDAADTDSAEDEAEREERQAGAGERKHEVGGGERGGASDEHLGGAAPVAAASRGNADQGGGHV